MEAGSSWAGATSQSLLPELPRKERKPRHKSKKGKEREGDGKAAPAKTETPPPADTALNEAFTVAEASPWAWAFLSETSVSSRPPVFTNDCRYFFLIAGSSVKIYATATGQVVSTLSSSSGSASSSSQLSDGHTDDITAAFVNPRNAYQLMTASLDGRIKVWDYLEATLLSTIEVGEPITHMCAHAHVQDHVFVATTLHESSKKNDALHYPTEGSKVYRVSLRPSRATADGPIYKPVEIFKVGKTKSTTGLAISPSGAWLVATGGDKAYVCSTNSLGSGFITFVSNEMLTCLAFHPSEDYFATGDQEGQIRLWYCLNSAQASSRVRGEKRAQTTTLHWHAHAVSTVAFTANGSYLLSGGEEAVLVIWQLNTGKREFVPRVGAPIVSVAVASHQSSEEEFLLVLSDGTLSFVGSGTLGLSRSFSRIKHDPNYLSAGPAPLAVHSRTSTIILPSSHPSSLLIYEPSTSTLLAELEVSPSNRVSRRDKQPIEPSRVTLVAVSDDGEWLATIDGRERSEDFVREIYMKIWQWDQTSSTWSLNSRIDKPHGDHPVQCLTFSPQGDRPCIVSTGNDGSVKAWRVKSASSKKAEEEVFWVCRSTFTYRSEIPTDAVCSPDGSLLAVAHGRHVVIYQLSNNVVRLVLTCPEVREVFRVAFIGSGGRYVMVADHQIIVMWDLITSTIRWRQSFPNKICHVISHPKDDSFIVIYRGTHTPTLLGKFGVLSAAPFSSYTLPFELRKVVWYPYAGSGTDFTLIGITTRFQSVIFGDYVNLHQDEGSLAREILVDSGRPQKNIFQDIFGATAFQDFPLQTSTSSSSALEGAPAGLLRTIAPLDTPAHLLPPLHTLLTPLLESLLQVRDAPPTFDGQEVHELIEEEDVTMESPPPPGANPDWLPRNEELEELIEFFKQQTFSLKQMSAVGHKPTDRSNGNGITMTTNGAHDHEPSSCVKSLPINGKNHPPKRPTEHTQQLSPTIVGKKRKKNNGVSTP